MKIFDYRKDLTASFAGLVQRWAEQMSEGVDRLTIPYIRTFHGAEFRHLSPRVEDIHIEDIAHSLSRICRFTGHCVPSLYSVAEHAVRVSFACDPKDAFFGLHHDDAEAYCNDLARPFKRLPGMEGYRFYEKLVFQSIAEKFNLGPEPESVKKADLALLATEQRDIMPLRRTESGDGTEWPAQPLPEKIIAWTQQEAEERFLKRHYALLEERNAKQE